ncbi:MAG: hypothetical protein AAFV07_02295 [Bacteroidota bacterium]
MLSAQSFGPCERDYSLLKREIMLSQAAFEPGASLYLSRRYLHRLQSGDYSGIRSNLIHYVYIRPATKKEIKTGRVKGNIREHVGRDGMIYVAKSALPSTHFFEPTEAFAGDFAPQWEDPDLVIPMGLSPAKVGHLAGRPLTVVEHAGDYLLLKVGESYLVFYIGFPELPEVFDTPATLAALSEKQSLAEALIGQRYWLAPAQRSRAATTAPVLMPGSGWQQIRINDAHALRDRVVLSCAGLADQPFVISSQTRLRLLDAECVEETRRTERARLIEEAAPTDTLFAQLLDRTTDPAEWLAEAWVFDALQTRFMRAKPRGGASTYQYMLAPEGPARDTLSFVQAGLNELGQFWLESHFASPKGLYHTRITLFAGDTLISKRVPTLDARNRRRYTDHGVIEQVRFDQKQDEALVRYIATHCEEDIRIRYAAGGEFFVETELPQLYKHQVRDAWMLAQILRQRALAQDIDKE